MKTNVLSRTLLACALLLSANALAQSTSKTETITYWDNTTTWTRKGLHANLIIQTD